MQLKLYNFSKKHNSTKQLANDAQPVASFSELFLKQQTDIDNPTFLLDDSFRDCNYAYVPELDRFYFINKNRLGNAAIYEIECELDVLATYKTEILAYEAFVERCASSSYYREFFNDDLVSVGQQVVNFDQTQTAITGMSASSGSYVLRMAGGDADGVSTFVVDSLSSLAKLFDKDTYTVTQSHSLYDDIMMGIFDPYDYVISLSWSPLDLSVYISAGAYQSQIWTKWFPTGVNAYKLPNHKQIYLGSPTLARPAALYSDFRKLNPNFTRYKLQIPGVGIIDVDNNETSGDIDIVYTIQLDSGSAQVDLRRTSDLTHIATFNCDMYMPLQAGNDNISIGSTIAGVGSTIGSFASKGAGAKIGGVAASISVAENFIQPTPSTVGGMGGIGLSADPYIYFISECYQSGALPTEVAGRPCYKNIVLSNLAGFVKCGAASVEVAANESVKNKINAFLNDGFYIE